MEWIKHIAKHHNEWVRIVRDFGEDFYAEDLVQEMYIRVHKYTTYDKIVKDGEVNKGFIWFVLRNIFVDFTKQKNKFYKVNIDEARKLSSDDLNTEQIEAQNIIHDKIEQEIDSWHWYDTMLFKLYRESGMSMRELEKETKISLTSIFHTIKDCKSRLRNSVGEDYVDFINQDYEWVG